MTMHKKCKGDRRAAGPSNLPGATILSHYGRSALEELCDDIGRAREALRRVRMGNDLVPTERLMGDELEMDGGMNQVPPEADFGPMLRSVGMDPDDPADKKSVKKFLNRILACAVEDQNRLFRAFFHRLNEKIDTAHRNGEYDAGVADVKATSIRAVGPPEVVYTVPVVGAQTQLYKLSVDRGVAWEAAVALLKARRLEAPEDTVSAFYRSHHPIIGSHLYVLALLKDDHHVHIYRPNTGKANGGAMQLFEMKQTYKRVEVLLGAEEEKEGNEEKNEEENEEENEEGRDEVMVDVIDAGSGSGFASTTAAPVKSAVDGDAASLLTSEEEKEEARRKHKAETDRREAARLQLEADTASFSEAWTKKWETSASPAWNDTEPHFPLEKSLGGRFNAITLLSGPVLPLWSVIEDVIRQNHTELLVHERKPRIVRVPLDDGRSIVGVSVPPSLFSEITARLYEQQRSDEARSGQVLKDPVHTSLFVKQATKTPQTKLRNFFKSAASSGGGGGGGGSGGGSVSVSVSANVNASESKTRGALASTTATHTQNKASTATPAAPALKGWECVACTFENAASRSTCQMCATKRSKGSSKIAVGQGKTSANAATAQKRSFATFFQK